MSRSRCAIYARYSTDKQSPRSIDDQVRMCREWAERQGWEVLEEHLYFDGAISAASADRPGLSTLLSVAFAPARPFDVILLDDTSRLSRNQAETMRLFERFNFAGVRVVAVSQGIDSTSEQADVLMTVHGLVDSLYVKELAKKTHRGLEGKVLRGFHAGGRCFGYCTEKTPEGVRLRVEPREAEVVRRIFRMSASGQSLKRIAKKLNADGVPPSRGRALQTVCTTSDMRRTWCPSAIREMLRRELYCGRVVWNRSRFIKRPGTNKRVQRPRPPHEWKIAERPELCIVSESLWRSVQERLAWLKETYSRSGPAGVMTRAASSPHFLTGLLKCGECGGNLTIVVGLGRNRLPRYGCPKCWSRGACSNRLTEREDRIEERLFSELQNEVLKPEAVEFAIDEFALQLKTRLAGLASKESDAVIRQRKEKLEQELAALTTAQRLSEAMGKGELQSLVMRISKCESELRDITDRSVTVRAERLEADLEAVRKFVTEQLNNIKRLVRRRTAEARMEFVKHVKSIRMTPCRVGAERFYVAEGRWDLLGNSSAAGPRGQLSGWPPGMVAGAGFEPATFGL